MKNYILFMFTFLMFGLSYSQTSTLKGKKTGKWFFWSSKNFTEVNFQNNKVISHFKWENQNVVAVK